MASSQINFAEENPFSRILIREFILWFFIFLFGLSIQIVIILAIINRDFIFEHSNFKNLDPILQLGVAILAILLPTAWLWQRCKLVGINLKYLIGEVPKNYQWLSLFGLIFATNLFYRGTWRVSYYLLSFIAPAWVENIINQSITNNLLVEASKSFYPPFYIVLYIMSSWVINAITIGFIFQGFFLHRLSFKWGIRKAFLALLLLFAIGSYPYIITGAIVNLVLIILYFKTRTLIIPIVALILESIISYPLGYLLTTYWYSQTNNVLERFQEGIGLWILLLVIPAPWVIGFIYKNFPNKNTLLPYFANLEKAEYRELNNWEK